MRPGLAAALVLAALPAAARGQTLAAGPVVALADYREVAADLQYRGAGFGATASASYKKTAVEIGYVRMRFEPGDEGSAGEAFTVGQFDLRLRYHLTGGVSAEVGVTNRRADPEFAAQSAGAARLGLRLSNLIGRGVRLGLRGAYLLAGRFSGGGRAPLGIEIGLGVAGEFLRGRLRLGAEYEFQYFNRKTDGGTGEVSVPIQLALVRLGAVVGF